MTIIMYIALLAISINIAITIAIIMTIARLYSGVNPRPVSDATEDRHGAATRRLCGIRLSSSRPAHPMSVWTSARDP
jgi:hypothetical protein